MLKNGKEAGSAKTLMDYYNEVKEEEEIKLAEKQAARRAAHAASNAANSPEWTENGYCKRCN